MRLLDNIMTNRILLKDMTARQEGSVLEILGGDNLEQRLKAIGIRPGVKIARVSQSSRHGPIIVKVAGTQIAIGFGMCHKIAVGVDS
jgi:Fe2+ transport system protein FeoA